VSSDSSSASSKPNQVVMQDKAKEIEFFDHHAVTDDYNVFSDAASKKLIDHLVAMSGLDAGGKVLDLGCGSGVFTHLLHQRGFHATGLDLSPKLLELARAKYPQIRFVEGDVEKLPFEDGAADGVLLSGIVHHLPNPERCAAEVYRVLGPGGRFVAFDPNRANPFMFLYRDPASPFHSSVGVTENERPVRASEVAAIFTQAGFRTFTGYVSGLSYRYVASSLARLVLPVYNAFDAWLFRPRFMKHMSPFVVTYGVKE
jgi:ubiquinone/menaquinone biosynthesis C-methylase UbiE